MVSFWTPSNWEIISFHNAVGDIMPDAVTVANPQILTLLSRVGVVTAIDDQRPNGIHFTFVKCSFKLTDIIDTDEVSPLFTRLLSSLRLMSHTLLVLLSTHPGQLIPILGYPTLSI